MSRFPKWVLVSFLSVAPMLVCAQDPYYPLAVGNRWTYVVEHGIFSGTREVRVVAEEDGAFVVRTETTGSFEGSLEVRLAGDGNAIDIELPVEGFVPHYRFGEKSWIHRSVLSCDDGAEVTVIDREENVDTPAGTFTAASLVFASRCADAGRMAEWWAPGVGLVKAEDGNFTGEVTWLLSDYSVAGGEPDGRFRRGDSNDDGGVDIADMVHVLNHLFGGGPGPDCLDIIDINDDGSVDISDPVYGLTYLFAGGPAPPSPGPIDPGFDGTPTDPFLCGDDRSRALPGVSVDLSPIPDSLTLAEAAAGVTFRFDVVLEEEVLGVVSDPLDAGRCDQPGPSGLRLFERITGGDQSYCLCDVGLCLQEVEPLDLSPGRYEESFDWSGRNWFGPSDTGNPMGEPFPPGRYVVAIEASGTYRGPDGEELPFEIVAAKQIELLP